MDKKLKVPHVWALGVGIVLVGEFMGWNSSIKIGGTTGALIGIPIIALMYLMIVFMTSEMANIIPGSGGQYAMANHLLGPLGGFNVGLMMFMQYSMLEAADALVVGQLLKSIIPDVQVNPFLILTDLALTYVNYHGTYGTLTLNLVITVIAFAGVLILLFSTKFYSPHDSLIRLSEYSNGLPFGKLGIFAALQFSCWFFLGIEGTAMVTDECENPKKTLPLGAIIGLITLCIGGNATWFICSGMIPADKLSDSVYPLYESAVNTGKPVVAAILFVCTMLSCIASANGCISDSAKALYVMSRDGMLPELFGTTHPKFKSPYRALVCLTPVPIIFATTGMLDQIVSFSIFSALMVYTLTCIMMLRARKLYPLDIVKHGFVCPGHPVIEVICLILIVCALFGMFLNYSKSMFAVTIFYLVSSLWCIKRRDKFV